MMKPADLHQTTRPSLWALVDQKSPITFEAAEYLSKQLNLPWEVRLIQGRWPWCWMPYHWWSLRHVKSKKPFSPPWPNIILAAGPRAQATAIAIRELTSQPIFITALTPPSLPYTDFDLIAVPSHEPIEGMNILPCKMLLHHMTMRKIQDGAQCYDSRLKKLPHPLISHCIDHSDDFPLTSQVVQQLVQDSWSLHRTSGGGLLIWFTSNVLPAHKEAIKAGVEGLPTILEEGPYEKLWAFWGQADYILLMRGSLEIFSYAAATDVPLFIYPTAGESSTWSLFESAILAHGIFRLFEGQLQFWARAPYHEAHYIASVILEHFQSKLNAPYLER